MASTAHSIIQPKLTDRKPPPLPAGRLPTPSKSFRSEYVTLKAAIGLQTGAARLKRPQPACSGLRPPPANENEEDRNKDDTEHGASQSAADDADAIAELARALDAPRSTIYELVGALTDAGLLEFSPDGKQVFFGKLMHLYGAGYLRENELVRRGSAEVDRLSMASGETCELCVLHHNRQAIIHAHPGARPQHISSVAGAQIPLPWTASGRLLLSQLSADDIEALIAPEDLLLPDGRTLPLSVFIDECHAAKGVPIIVTKGLINSLTQCLAAPVWGSDHKLVATICMVPPIDVAENQVSAWMRDLITSSRRLSLNA